MQRSIMKYASILLALILMLSACAGAAAEQEKRKMESSADAEEWIAVFLGDHPEKLDGVWLMTAQMEAAAASIGGMGGLARQMAALGTVEKISSAFETELQGYRVFHVPCVFSVLSVDLLLVVQDGAIAGLQTDTYSGNPEKEEAGSDDFDSIALSLPVPSLGELPGILTVPRGDGPFPAVVLLHGSGPSDQDETIGNLKPFRDLAEGLSSRGIAVFRFDKRTFVYGEALAAKKEFSLEEETIEDAVNAVQLLAGQERVDPGRIFVLGHSLGGNAIPAIAEKLRHAPVNASGYIMLAASPRPLEELMKEQYQFLYSLLPELTAEQQAEKDALISELDKLQNLDSMTEEDTVAGVYAAYWKWLAAYDILQTADRITEPVLLLQGEEDYQVTMKDFSIWRESFGEKANWQLISYPGLTHAFTPGRKEEGSAVYARDERVDAQVIQDIAEFIMTE